MPLQVSAGGVSLRSSCVEENRRRTRHDPEFELIDTGVFRESRYFDVFVEYAKAAPDDILIRITAFNRGPGAAPTACAAHRLVPQHLVVGLAMWQARVRRRTPPAAVELDEPYYGRRWLYCDGAPELLFTENESQPQRLWHAQPVAYYARTASASYVVHGEPAAVNPERPRHQGRGALRRCTLAAGRSRRNRRTALTDAQPADPFGRDVRRQIFADRIREADEILRHRDSARTCPRTAAP